MIIYNAVFIISVNSWRVISFAKVMIEVTVPVNFEHEQKFSSI